MYYLVLIFLPVLVSDWWLVFPVSKRYMPLDSSQFVSLFFFVISFVVVFLYLGIFSYLFSVVNHITLLHTQAHSFTLACK